MPSTEPTAINPNPYAGFQAIFPGTSQKKTTSGSSQQSSAVGANTTIVRLYATQDTYVEIGSNPTATTTTSMFLPLGFVEYFGITPGHKIAYIQSTSAGTLFITEGAQI